MSKIPSPADPPSPDSTLAQSIETRGPDTGQKIAPTTERADPDGPAQDRNPASRDDADSRFGDLAVFATALRRCEIAGYVSARTLAELIGETNIAGLFQEALDKERVHPGETTPAGRPHVLDRAAA